MPLTGKGSEVLSSMVREYGEAKGKEVFYASKNAGRITGVDSLLASAKAIEGVSMRLDALASRADSDFKEGDHPRGQPGNAGQFGSGGGGAGSGSGGGKSAGGEGKPGKSAAGGGSPQKKLTNDPKLDDKEKKVISSYGEGNSYNVNKYLRDPKAGKAEAKKHFGARAAEYTSGMEKTAKVLDKAIAKSTLESDAVLYRGVSDFDHIIERVKGLKSGDSFNLPTFSSTSRSKEWASDFMKGKSGNKGMIVINAKAGAHALDMDEFARHKGEEQEMLLGRNTDFKLDKYDPDTGTVFVTISGDKKADALDGMLGALDAISARLDGLTKRADDFRESEHPRAEDGKFGSGGGGSGSESGGGSEGQAAGKASSGGKAEALPKEKKEKLTKKIGSWLSRDSVSKAITAAVSSAKTNAKDPEVIKGALGAALNAAIGHYWLGHTDFDALIISDAMQHIEVGLSVTKSQARDTLMKVVDKLILAHKGAAKADASEDDDDDILRALTAMKKHLEADKKADAEPRMPTVLGKTVLADGMQAMSDAAAKLDAVTKRLDSISDTRSDADVKKQGQDYSGMFSRHNELRESEKKNSKPTEPTKQKEPGTLERIASKMPSLSSFMTLFGDTAVADCMSGVLSALDSVSARIDAFDRMADAYDLSRDDASPQTIARVRALYERPGTMGEKAAAKEALIRLGAWTDDPISSGVGGGGGQNGFWMAEVRGYGKKSGDIYARATGLNSNNEAEAKRAAESRYGAKYPDVKSWDIKMTWVNK